MVNIVVEMSKYLMAFMMVFYTYECFAVFNCEDEQSKKHVFLVQNVLMFLTHFLAFLVMYLKSEENKMIEFYVMQAILLLAVIVLYMLIYPKISRLVVNNMCMLLSIGFVMITRISYKSAVKQFVIVAGAAAICLVVPVFIRKCKALSEWRILYGIVGVISLAIVIVVGRVSYGAMLGFEIAGISIQPSELVKLIFVFFVASSLKEDVSFKNVAATTIVAAVHVLILVASKDLGAALIIFMVYLVMLYVATRQPLYAFAGMGAGAGASVVAYHLFSHVRVRVDVWKDPFAAYESGGYQVAQALMAIGTGGWFGMGLFQGAADKIPVAESDFIFAAIAEEMGILFGLCIILVCVSVYVMFLNIAMRLRDRFYKLVALGLGTCYIVQSFLNIGGVVKFIPSTGVTLPLVSYGGTSLLSTLIMFGIIQGLYLLREDEEEDIERKKAEQLRRRRSGSKADGSSRRTPSEAAKEKRPGTPRARRTVRGVADPESTKLTAETGTRKKTRRKPAGRSASGKKPAI